MVSMDLRTHGIHLEGRQVGLRPMTETDWAIITPWETDPEVTYWADTGPGAVSRTIEDVKHIFRTISQNAYCFVIEYTGDPIGTCWLQKMNLPEIIERFPGKDCRRIDLSIGVQRLWGHGLGTDTIRTLVRFAFELEQADIVFGIAGDYNPRSIRAFSKAGFQRVFELAEPPGSRAQYTVVQTIERGQWQVDESR